MEERRSRVPTDSDKTCGNLHAIWRILEVKAPQVVNKAVVETTCESLVTGEKSIVRRRIYVRMDYSRLAGCSRWALDLRSLFDRICGLRGGPRTSVFRVCRTRPGARFADARGRCPGCGANSHTKA